MITVDDTTMEWHEEMTLATLLATLPDTEFCSVVRLNGKLVSSPKFGETRVPDRAVIFLLPLVAGG